MAPVESELTNEEEEEENTSSVGVCRWSILTKDLSCCTWSAVVAGLQSAGLLRLGCYGMSLCCETRQCTDLGRQYLRYVGRQWRKRCTSRRYAGQIGRYPGLSVLQLVLTRNAQSLAGTANWTVPQCHGCIRFGGGRGPWAALQSNRARFRVAADSACL